MPESDMDPGFSDTLYSFTAQLIRIKAWERTFNCSNWQRVMIILWLSMQIKMFKV